MSGGIVPPGIFYYYLYFHFSMIRIAITSDHSVDNEAERIAELLRNRFDIVHLRKPTWTADECRRLLDKIDSRLYKQIVIHDFYELYTEYNLRGIHLTGRHPEVPEGLKPEHVSCSCHSFEEVVRRKDAMNYVFLSPIFDSISKTGYKSPFTNEMLKQAASQNIIDGKVVALGGITDERVSVIEEIGFGGYAMLGNVW